MNEVIHAAWMDDAACKGRDVNDFFRPHGVRYDDVAELCVACPVRIECVEYALADPTMRGYWGGMSERQRRQERSRRGDRTKRFKRAPCGTAAAYMAHRRRDETPCRSCTEAHAARNRENAQARRVSVA